MIVFFSRESFDFNFGLITCTQQAYDPCATFVQRLDCIIVKKAAVFTECFAVNTFILCIE